MKIDRIVAYGCSFTAGQELGDAEILQIDVDVLDEMKRDGIITDNMRIYKTREIQEKCDELGLSLSWPSHLAKKIDIPYLNRGMLGTSLGDAVFRLTHDLEHGLIHDNDLIVIGATCPARFSALTENRFGHMAMITRMLGHASPFWPSKEIHEFMVRTWGTDNNIIWEYVKLLKYLDLLSDSLGGRIKMITPLHSWNHLIRFGYPNHMKWISNMKFKHLLDKDFCFAAAYGDTPHEETVHGWRHPKLKYHIKFADLVYDMLKDRNIIQ